MSENTTTAALDAASTKTTSSSNALEGLSEFDVVDLKNLVALLASRMGKDATLGRVASLLRTSTGSDAASTKTTTETKDADFEHLMLRPDEFIADVIKAKDKIVSELEITLDHAQDYAQKAYNVTGYESVCNREAFLNLLDKITELRIRYQAITDTMLGNA